MTKPISQYQQTQTRPDTNRRTHCIYTSGRLGGGAKGRSVRGEEVGALVDEEGGVGDALGEEVED